MYKSEKERINNVHSNLFCVKRAKGSRVTTNYDVECSHPRDQQPRKYIGTKGSVYIRES